MPHQPTILVIEDNRLQRETTSLILAKAGYEVLKADDGAAGLALAITHRPEVVLVDVLLPGTMDGLDVCHEIRSTPGLEATSILVLSSLGQAGDVAAGRLYGADDYLTKPVKADILLERIETILSARGGR